MRHHVVPRSMSAIGSPPWNESGGGGCSSTKAITGRSARKAKGAFLESRVLLLERFERRERPQLIIGSDQKRQHSPGALLAKLPENLGEPWYDLTVREPASGIDVIGATRDSEQLA